MKNNKGVTLVELLIVIVVMGIIAAFAVPSVGQIIENTQRSAIYADALAVEQAAALYCADTLCTDTQSLTWTQLQDQVEGIDAAYYDFTNNSGVIATKTASGWTVDLEAAGTGEWEFTQNLIPSATDRDDVVEDVD
jgi:type IV pilus assembly protein PilA